MHVDKYSCTYLYTYALSFFHLVFCVNFPGVVEYMRTVHGCKVEELELCLPDGKQLRDGGACSPSDTLQLPVGAVHIPLRNCTLTASAGKHKIQ